jgi:hypothetical protein
MIAPGSPPPWVTANRTEFTLKSPLDLLKCEVWGKDAVSKRLETPS